MSEWLRLRGGAKAVGGVEGDFKWSAPEADKEDLALRGFGDGVVRP